MEVPGNPGIGHMGLQHNHVSDNDLGGGSKVMDQSAYYAMTGHHGNMYHGNPQHQQPSQPGMKSYSGAMEGPGYNQMMGSPPGINSNAGGGIHGTAAGRMPPHNMGMYKSPGMIGHGNAGSAGMGMGRAYRGQGMNQYGNMMQHGMQHNVGAMAAANRGGGMMPGGGHMQPQGMPHMMAGGGGGAGQQQAGMVNVHGHYVAQQYADMSHHQSHHPQQHHQQQQQQHSQQHHQYMGSPPNPCLMSPPPPQGHTHQQMQHTSPTMAQHGYSPSIKSYQRQANMVMEAASASQLQQSQLHTAHTQQQQQQQQQQSQQRAPQTHYQQQQQHQQHGMATVNLNQMNHPMSSSTKQLPGFRTLSVAASAAGGAGAGPANMSPGMQYAYSKSVMGVQPQVPCDGSTDSSGTGANSMPMEVGMDNDADLSVGPHGQVLTRGGLPHPFSPSSVQQQRYGTTNTVGGGMPHHANHALSQGNHPQNQQMLHHLRTMQSSGVTLNVTSSSVVTQTASAVSPAVTTTHVAPVVSHSALQNPVLTSRLKSGPAVHNANEMNASLCPPLRNPHQSLPSPTMQSPPQPSSMAVAKHLCSPTSAISHSGCSQQPYNNSTIPTSLATSGVSSLASAAPAISALLSGNRGGGGGSGPVYDRTSKNMSCPNMSSPSCPTDNHHHHHHQPTDTHRLDMAPPCSGSGSYDKRSLPPSGGGFEHGKQGVSSTSTSVVTVTVPFGWRRVVEAGAVAYYSASGVRITSLSHATKYLQTDGTCKCGLECPLLVEKVFNFDPQVASKQWNSNEISFNDDLTKLCNHKRKIIAMATFHKSAFQRDRGLLVSLLPDGEESGSSDISESNKKDHVLGKRHMNSLREHPYDRTLVSRILAQQGQSPGEGSRHCTGDIHTGHERPVSAHDAHTGSSVIPKQEPGHECNDKANHKFNSTEQKHSHINRVIKEEKCETAELKPQDTDSEFSVERQGIDRKPDLKSIAQKVQAALRNQDRAGGCSFSTGWNKQRPRAQSDGYSPSVPSENDMPNHFHRSLSDSTQNHHPYEKQGNAYPQRVSEHPFNNQASHHGGRRYLPMDVHMALSAKTDPHSGVSNHNMKHLTHGKQNFPADLAASEEQAAPPTDLSLQIPGLPTMESWAEMQKVGRKKPLTKRNNKRKLNHILDRSSPCPNVDVRHMQQENRLMAGVPSFFENPSTFLAHQSALVANSLNKTDIQTEGMGEYGGSAGSQLSPSPSISSLSTKSATPTGKLTPLSSPGRPCSRTSPACSSTSSTPMPFQGPSSKPGPTHLSPRQVQQLELQKQLHMMASGSSFSRALDMMDPVTATLSAGKEKVPKDEGRGSPQITSLNLHTVLNPRSSSSFPASSLLSAAARAQGGKQQKPTPPAENTTKSPQPTSQQHPQLREFRSSSQSQENARHVVSNTPEPPYHHMQHQPHHHHHHPQHQQQHQQQHQHQQQQQHHQQHQQQEHHQQMSMMKSEPDMSFMAGGMPNNTRPAMFHSQLSPGQREMNPRGAVMMSPRGHLPHSNFAPHMTPGFMNQRQVPSRQVPPATHGELEHCSLKEQTPIEKVQDMISGLEAAQNAIVAAHAAATAQEAMGRNPDGTWPVKRRKSSTSSDGSVLSRQSTSRCSNGGAATEMPLTPGMEQMMVDGYRGPPPHPHPGEGMMTQNHLYGGPMALSNSVDGTMDPNGPAAGAAMNPNALAGTPQGLPNTALPMVNMNITGAMPPSMSPASQITAGTSAVSPVLPTGQLNNPRLMHILGGNTALQQNSLLVSNPVGSAQGALQSPEMTPEKHAKVSPVPTQMAVVRRLLKNQESEHQVLAQEEETTAQHKEESCSPSDTTRTSPHLKQAVDEWVHAEKTASRERKRTPSGRDKMPNGSFSLPPGHLHVQTDLNTNVALPPPMQTSPRAAWPSAEPKPKRRRERTRKSSTPTIASMLQAAQNPQVQNQTAPVVMLPGMQTPLLQVVNPVLSQIVGQMPEGGMNQQQLMYLSLAMQNPQLNAQMLQNQDLSAAFAMAASQAQMNLGQQLSPIPGQPELNCQLQNQLNMMQAMNMSPVLNSVNPALLQGLQAMPNVVGLQNLATLQQSLTTLQPHVQQQMLRQVGPLLVQNQQMLQQMMNQQGMAVAAGVEDMAQLMADQQQSLEKLRASEVSSDVIQDMQDHPDVTRISSQHGALNPESRAGMKVPTSTCGIADTTDQFSKKLASQPEQPSSKLDPNQRLIAPNGRADSWSSPEDDYKVASPADTTIPNPANLTQAVTAVVRSQDVFGDDDSTHRIEPPLRKYAVRKPRNHVRRISGSKQTETTSPPLSLSPTSRSPVARALTFETSAVENHEDNLDDVSSLPGDVSEGDVIPEHHISMNSIGTNTDEDGCLENPEEDMEASLCQSDTDEVLMGTNMASTATMTDEEPLTEMDHMTEDEELDTADDDMGEETDNMSDIASDAADNIVEYDQGDEEDTCPSEMTLEQQTDENTDEANTIEDVDAQTPLAYAEEESLPEEGPEQQLEDGNELDDPDDKSSQVATDSETMENHVLHDGTTDADSDVQSEPAAAEQGLQDLMEQSVQDDGEDNDNNDLEDESADSSDELPKSGCPRTFNIGDVVWGPIRGFPSWPGKVVAETAVKGNHHKSLEGKMWVRWFGDHSFTQVEPDELKTLSEGLEAHHHDRQKYRRGRKMNTSLEAAIQEAMLELDRQATEASTSKPEKASPPAPPAPSMETTPPLPAATPTAINAACIVKSNKSRPLKKRKR